MIKTVLAAICLTAASSVSYANSHATDAVQKEYVQKVPKTVIIKTKKFKIRIDQQPNEQYLYQSWSAKGKLTSKPSMIISNGEIIPDGTGGNYYYEFQNEGYTYQIWRNYLTDSVKKPPYTLKVIDPQGHIVAS
ncbi:MULTISPECIES: hypothetical protein [Chryseobacterium]|uniref:Uncharacterized protein n=1 Tax=Chryseobacterium camelliae TaxID=1265445 RepID=A0ABU0TKF2_9FLAO|nr:MULTISPECIES: hypothetical protein [Chryseobacterium]MDT3409365.1 hypothetical protein [Pseudacidovorax intermedius]MDQ1096770.1 hypothetical protein [Chryseobacterium camelliae]MDQ1100713.1 hypothetical protein [Chryseobacterium sp. SORGH_AS_1048]MDR6088052.1 hypothetical protein [Chryseobacterium sp. SORGH_AS_0909]MDR6132426.1 hypothetical protein [Chryseobacterium sp. SORGH_AS_1175]